MKARSIGIGIVALVSTALLVPVASAATVTPNPKIRFSSVIPNPSHGNTVTPNPRIRFGIVTPNPRIRFTVVTPNPRFWGGDITNPRIRW